MVTIKNLFLVDEAATRALGAALAPILTSCDVIALHGVLGAGKTTLARGLIQARTGSREPVPSPTFTMVQIYEGPTPPAIWHFDLYRTEHSDELVELGWDEALASGIVLIEWPERAGPALPTSTLWLTLTPEREGRTAVLSAAESCWERWAERLETAL